MTSKIEFGLYGTHLGTRFLGYNIREKILADFDNVEKFIFNFSGVETISESFADECFGKLLFDKSLEMITEKISYEDVNNFVKTIISREIKKRHKQQEDEKEQ